MQHEQPLFDEDEVRVTPGWFTLEGSSHAMHTVVRVSMTDRAVSRGSWTVLFFTCLPLIGFAAYGFWRTGMPWWLAFALFAASIALALTAAWFAFVARDAQRLDVRLADGTLLSVQRPGRRFVSRLNDALLRAMDWHLVAGATSPADRGRSR